MSTQEYSDQEFDTAADPARDDTIPTEGRQHRFRRSRQPKPPAIDSPEASASALTAELMLLREENAWLKAAQHQAPGIGQAIQRVRSLPGEQPQADDSEDAATQVLVEVHVLRESLVELCSEVQRALATVQARLDELAYAEPDERQRLEDPLTDPSLRASVIHITDGKKEDH